MAQTSITLTASMRSNLASLKSIQKQMDTTQERLSTGKKVNSAIDNASSYYQSRSLTNRASDLDSLLDSMGQGIQTIQAANEGIEAITSYVEQLKSVATNAFALDATAETYEAELTSYQEQYNDILKEIGTLAKDSSYQGVNLLKGSTLTVMFNETRTHQLDIVGDNVTEQMNAKGANAFAWDDAASTSNVGNGTIDWVAAANAAATTEEVYTAVAAADITVGTTDVSSYYTKDDATGEYTQATGTAVADTTYYTMEEVETLGSAASAIDATLDDIATVTTYLRNYATELGNNFTIIETRQDFTDALIDVLETGSDNLVLADMNEESANYLALQTRQQLAINSLSLASQSAQSVLSLF